MVKKIKSNPYVYPFTPYANLDNKNFVAKFVDGEIVSNKEIKNLLKKNELKISLKGKSVSEKIYNIFLNDEVLFGPKEYLENNRNYWLEKINYFITKQKPIKFTILGFPFKIPNPLKTNRKLPDFGELLALKKLFDIASLIKKIYSSGAIVYIFTEGVFGRFNNLSKKESDNYKKQLKKMVRFFKWDKLLKIIDLQEMEKFNANFKKTFEKEVKLIKTQYQKNNREIIKKYEGAKKSIYHIVNTRDLNLTREQLMDLYNENLPDEKLTPKIKKARKKMEKLTYEMIIKYFAYLSLRDKLDFINKKVPHGIALSVSPKPNRLGIIPVGRDIIRLPYHGVPVYNSKLEKFTIEYLIDIQRMNFVFKKIYWVHDKEKKPFFYIMANLRI